MKRLIYCVIIAMSISLAFSQGTPCCNKKTGKNTVSCKFNHLAIGVKKDATGEVKADNTDGDQKSFKRNKTDGNKCTNSCANKKPLWKFWAKKSTKNCPSKQT